MLSLGYICTRGDIEDFHVTKYSDVAEKIIPFFAKYPLLGLKREYLKDFYLVAALIYNKEHLTVEGLEKIKEIKSRMNASRESAS